MRPDELAVQLYTLRALLADDLSGTLRAVAGAGYHAVELAGLPPLAAEALRDELDAAGLQPMGSHESLEALRSDTAGVLGRMAVLGCPRIVVPWLPEAERSTVEGVRSLALELGRISGACGDRGIRLGYHNHEFEFAPLDGTSIWDVLLAELPATVDLELDVYWATVGGQDPVALIRNLDERLRLLHMKDMDATPGRGDVTPGDGILAWSDIAAAAAQRGPGRAIEWYVVEEDNPRDAIAEIARGRAFLAALTA